MPTLDYRRSGRSKSTDRATKVPARSKRHRQIHCAAALIEAMEPRYLLSGSATITEGGTMAAFTVAGSGTAAVVPDGNSFDLAVTGTTSASSLNVSVTGSGEASLDKLTVSGSLGRISAPNLQATQINITGTLGSAVFGNLSGTSVTIGGTNTPMSFSAGSVTDLSVTSASPIRSIATLNWAASPGAVVNANLVTSPSLGKLTVTGDAAQSLSGNCAANLSLSGSAGPALGSVSTAGSVSGLWKVAGSGGSISAGQVAPGFSADFAGTVHAFNDESSFSGKLLAENIGTLWVKSDLTGAVVIAGASDDPLTGSATTYGPGGITTVKAGGNVINSVIGAGFDAVNDIIQGTEAASFIRSISIGGSVEGSSSFAAAGLPRVAAIGGGRVTTSVDPHFFFGGISITSLSQSSVSPESLLQINGTGFNPSVPAWVELVGPDNNLAVVPVSQISATAVVVSVPSLANANGQLEAGAVTVQVVQQLTKGVISSNTLGGLTINLPPAPAGPAGTLTEAFLQGTAGAATTMESAIVGTTFNTAALRKSLNGEIQGLNSSAQQVQTLITDSSKTFALGATAGNPVTITQNTLANTDRLLLAMLNSLAQPAVTSLGTAALVEALPAASDSTETVSQSASAAVTAAEQGTPQLNALVADMYNPHIVSDSASAFGTAMSVIGGAGGLAIAGIGIAGLALAVPAEAVTLAVALPTAALLYVTLVSGGGLIGVGGVLEQTTAEARALVQTGVDQINELLTAAVVKMGIVGGVGALLGHTPGEAAGLIAAGAASANALYNVFAHTNVQPAPLATYTLALDTTGTGTGTLTASPAGPNYTAGTRVTITAHPVTGSTFAGFASGGDLVTMNSDQSVTGIFNLKSQPPPASVTYTGSEAENTTVTEPNAAGWTPDPFTTTQTGSTSATLVSSQSLLDSGDFTATLSADPMSVTTTTPAMTNDTTNPPVSVPSYTQNGTIPAFSWQFSAHSDGQVISVASIVNPPAGLSYSMTGSVSVLGSVVEVTIDVQLTGTVGSGTTTENLDFSFSS